MLSNRNNSYLNWRNLWWKYKTFIITMYHNNSTNHSCRYTPRSLMWIMRLIVPTLESNVKLLCKAITKVMRCTTLKCNTVVHHWFNSVCFFSTGKFFFFCFSTDNSRNSKCFLIEVSINL